VSGERIEVEIEPVNRKERAATRGQALSERVDDPMRHVLRAGAEFKHGKNLGERIDGQPHPEHLLRTPKSGAQPGPVEGAGARDGEMGALVQDLSMQGLRASATW
jgi:hypothetical protein